MVRKYPAIVLLAGVVLGIVTSDLFGVPSLYCLLFSIVAACSAVFLFFRNKVMAATFMALLCISGVTASRFAVEVYDHGPRHYIHACSESVRYQTFGTVVDWPDIRAARTNIVIQLDSVGQNLYRHTEGLVMVSVSDTGTMIQRGDRIELIGSLMSPNRGGLDRFDYRRYLNLKGISAVVYLPTFLDIRVEARREPGVLSFVDNVRGWIVETFWSALTPSAAALAQGFLIGETRHIPQEVYTLFRDTGTLHVLAVSGSNVGLVIFVLYAALFPLPLRPSARSVLLIVAIILFAMVSYGEPSVTRAALMAVLIVSARLLQRRVDLNQIVALTAVILLLWQPSQFFDVGFQLSFVTAWGIVFVMSLIDNHLKGKPKSWFYYWIALPIIVSFVAQFFSAPLTVYYFGRLPAISFVANLVVVPLISIATVGSLIVLAGSIVLPALGQLLGGLLSPLMTGILWLLTKFNTYQNPVEVGAWMSPLSILLYFAILVVAIAAIWHRQQRRILVLLVFIALNVAAGRYLIRTAFSKEIPPTAFASTIPGGIMLLVPHGETADLVISGAEQTSYSVADRILTPALRTQRIQHINRLVLHAADASAITGLLELSRSTPIDTIFYPIHLTRVMSDIVAEFADSARVRDIALIPFGESLPSIGKDGIRISVERIVIDIEGRRIQIAANPTDIDTSKTGLVILSSPVVVDEKALLFHKETNAQIICADIAQANTRLTMAERTKLTDEQSPWLFVMSEFGGLQIVAGSSDSSGWMVIPAE